MKEEELVENVGVDASTFLRFLRLLRNTFSCISVVTAALLVLNIIYNLKYVDSKSRNALSLLTIQNLDGKWVWPALAASYVISESYREGILIVLTADIIIMFFGASITTLGLKY